MNLNPSAGLQVALGLGCDRGASEATLREAVAAALTQAGLGWDAVAAVASITLKADEAGLLALAAAQGWQPMFYGPETLAAVPVPNPSETVRRYTGTPSVSEAAALLAAGPDTPMSALLVEKHKHLGRDGKNATVSVARCTGERSTAERFTSAQQALLHRVMAARRDVRHFRPGGVIGADVRERLQHAIHTAPSVGLMQPWRFVRVTAAPRREAIAALVEAERQRTADALGERGQAFLALKVEGIRDCAEVWVVVLAPDDGTLFGRRTLAQEMAWCSVGCAIQNLWLAARAENLGLGWVSMFDPAALADLLALPDGSTPMGVLCLGPVDNFYPRPMLEQEHWRQRRPVQDFFIDDLAAD